MSAEAEYVRIMKTARRRQLTLTAENSRRLERTLSAAAEDIAARIEALPDEREGSAWHTAQFQLLSDIRTVLAALKQDYSTLLEVGMVQLAQVSADREVQTAELLGAAVDPRLLPNIERAVPLAEGGQATVQFGRLALDAVERTANRYYADGLKLSDRLYNLDATARKAIEDVLIHGIAEQVSAHDMARRLRSHLLEAGADNVRYKALRIARTEMRNAHTEAALLSVQSSPGVLKDYVSGLRWNLSLSHPAPDVCDLYATRDTGLGPGVYLPDDFPVSHPNCLCFQTAVLKAFPESGLGGAVPNPDAVSESVRAGFESAVTVTV